MTIFVLVVAILTCFGIVFSSIFKNSIKIFNHNINLYWVIALIGASTLILLQAIPINDVFNGLIKSSSVNPIKILILFISMSLISIFLDELGFFSFLSYKVLKHIKSNQFVLFIIFYLLVSLLTAFTSNDIIILTLTPFVINFAKRSKINPLPYLISEFIAANTFSMVLIIGNPTNIYIAGNFNIDFISYFLKMIIPTLCAAIIELSIMLLLFIKPLKTKINSSENTPASLKSKSLTIYGLIILLLTTALLVISNYIHLEMYLIALGGLLILILGSSIYSFKKNISFSYIKNTIKRGPYELIPFVLSMFVIVLTFSSVGLTQIFANFLSQIPMNNFTYGFSSLIVANLINNIPMSVFYTDVISFSNLINPTQAIYSSIIASNLGAFITPIGALAGIMFMNILKRNDIKYNFGQFIKFGLIVGIPVALITFLLV